jgi:signal transduction histidine kinase
VHQVAIVSKDITENLQKSEQIKSLNRELQDAVDKVQEKKTELVGTLAHLKETQSQILQSDKMPSIAQIFSEYRQFIKTVSDVKTSGPDRAAMDALTARIQEKESELDIAYILEDIPGLIHESREGLDRIKKIVLDLKDFSHPGEDILKLTDINRNMDSTLNIVWNELKYKATITKDYGELPHVKCYPQQLNQVFINLLVNAAQAIEDRGEIHIATREVDGNVEITVSDSGQGIAAENLSRIFDPFFTTKAVGKGTGLGLNVTYNIIKKHHGAIDVRSEPGKGTTFTIRIPVSGPEELNMPKC